MPESELKVGHFDSHDHSQEEHPQLSIEKVDIQVRNLIEAILTNRTDFLGNGLTAEVYIPEESEKICFKICCYREVLGKNPPKSSIRTTTTFEPSHPKYGYHSPDTEGTFLQELHTLSKEVDIPNPCCWAIYKQTDDGDTYSTKELIYVLAMERLDAVSIKDVIEKRAVLPTTFNFETFFKKLRVFISKMHEKGIYHRDLHEGNIMIDDNGNPCVIDFGKAARGFGDDVYDIDYREGGQLRKGKLTSDEEYVNQVERLLIKHMTKDTTV